MSPFNLIKTLVVVVVLGYLTLVDNSALLEARAFGETGVGEQNGVGENLQGDQNPLPLLEPARSSNLDSMDIDDDDDEDLTDDKQQTANGGPQLMSATGTNLFYNQPIAEQSQQRPTGDLKTSASHHHHGHGTKGWLDMGAWTGKKGAFGWYDKHPVGKGK